MKKRADLLIVELGWAKSRSQANELIKFKQIKYNGMLVTKASQKVDSENLEKLFDFVPVGRGYKKIDSMNHYFQIDFREKIVGDFGASTGGFTQYVLKKAAKKVYCIDVGHDQLAIELKSDPRVVNYEGINLKEEFNLEENIDFAMADLSFISLELVIQNILKPLKTNGEFLLLVKPQFEVGREKIGKGGLVKNDEDIIEVLEKIYHLLSSLGVCIKQVKKCPVEGKTGNREYFFYGLKIDQAHKIQLKEIDL